MNHYENDDLRTSSLSLNSFFLRSKDDVPIDCWCRNNDQTVVTNHVKSDDIEINHSDIHGRSCKKVW